jgi:hypothetical protein
MRHGCDVTINELLSVVDMIRVRLVDESGFVQMLEQESGTTVSCKDSPGPVAPVSSGSEADNDESGAYGPVARNRTSPVFEIGVLLFPLFSNLLPE